MGRHFVGDASLQLCVCVCFVNLKKKKRHLGQHMFELSLLQLAETSAAMTLNPFLDHVIYQTEVLPKLHVLVVDEFIASQVDHAVNEASRDCVVNAGGQSDRQIQKEVL